VVAETQSAVGRLRHDVHDLDIGNGVRNGAEDAEAAPEAREKRELLAVFEIDALDASRSTPLMRRVSEALAARRNV
jgi:hypothetical protein